MLRVRRNAGRVTPSGVRRPDSEESSSDWLMERFMVRAESFAARTKIKSPVWNLALWVYEGGEMPTFRRPAAWR